VGLQIVFSFHRNRFIAVDGTQPLHGTALFIADMTQRRFLPGLDQPDSFPRQTNVWQLSLTFFSTCLTALMTAVKNSLLEVWYNAFALFLENALLNIHPDAVQVICS